jgi:glycosyltransferase involved in cell wall biosynthesis
MNIAIITTWFPAGGGYVSKAYQQILEQEHNVFIYARGGKVMKGDPDWDHPNVTWAPWHENHIRVNHFIKWLKKKKIDIAFFNEQRYWKPVLSAKKAGVCIGAYIDYYTQETVPAFEIYDFLIYNTKRHYSVFNWHPHAYYVPWCTDIKKFKPKEKTQHNNVTTFIVSAGWQPMKRLDRRGSLLVLKALTKVKGNCKLLLYSQVDKNNFAKPWREWINDSRIELRTGTYDPFPYNEADVYLYPSRLDGIGLTLPEAISSGLAAITTDNGLMNEFVQDNVNGFLVKVDKYLGCYDGYYWAELFYAI